MERKLGLGGGGCVYLGFIEVQGDMDRLEVHVKGSSHKSGSQKPEMKV